MQFDPSAHTLTMAKVYAAQGHWEKAVEIYRHLLHQAPDREDIRTALAAAEARLAASGPRRMDELGPLLRRWLDLHTRCARLRQLKRMKGALGSPKRSASPNKAAFLPEDRDPPRF